MARIVTTKDKHILIHSTGHPANFRKVRCPKCSLGYCSEDPMKANVYKCARCGHLFGETPL